MDAARWTLAAIGIAALVVVVAYGVLAAVGEPLGSFFGSLAATFAGIVAGVPTALALSDRDRALQAGAATSERRQSRRRLLDQISADLQDTRDELLGLDRQPRGPWIVPFLGSGLWDAYKSDGSLDLIADPVLIRQISRAYDRIALTAYLEQRMHELLFAIGRGVPGLLSSEGPDVKVLASLVEQDKHTEGAIDVALQLINEDRARD